MRKEMPIQENFIVRHVKCRDIGNNIRFKSYDVRRLLLCFTSQSKTNKAHSSQPRFIDLAFISKSESPMDLTAHRCPITTRGERGNHPKVAATSSYNSSCDCT